MVAAGIPAVLSPNATDVGRVLVGDDTNLVDALLELNLIQDVVVASPAEGHELAWDESANGGSGAMVNRAGLNSEAFYVRKQVSQLIDNGATNSIASSWNVVTWDEANIAPESTAAFELEGGAGSTDRYAFKCLRAGQYWIEPRFSQHTLDNLTGDSLTGSSGRCLVYKGDDAATFAGITWSAIVGSTCYIATGPFRQGVGQGENGTMRTQSQSFRIPITLAVGERFRIDYQREVNGDSRIELQAAATAMTINGPFAN